MENGNHQPTNGSVMHPTKTTGKVITCKAAVVHGPGEPFVLEEILVEPPQKMEVRIKILFTSICHTDLSAWKGESESQRAFPRILGHEASGIVESVGEGVSDLKEGDQVVPIFNGECGECECCNHGRSSNMCSRFGVNPTMRVMVGDGRSRFWAKDGTPIYHFLNTSTFTEYSVLHSACVVKVDPQLAPHLKKLTLLSCGVSTGGAMGVTDFINPTELEKPVHERIREMTKGGVDYSFECAGNLDVLREAFLSTHEGWGFTVVLGIHPTPRMLPIHPMELFDGRRITASVFGGFKGKTQLPIFAQQCMQGVVELDKFITHELPFEKINEAFQLLVDGKSLRCILHL
ncbi:alcohol dehydrogenase-like 3 isoform X2 [Humulus lupulus]|uniref:alcohol dehydrogenase-like 3 isoform X2 n=1 Tax=Humulus lupulus TaxID=3486 RepID=UPI002B414BAB|nr:alcohol dehydrogenase-like 3 isoform X2 [Humulus lupulus]